MRPLPFSLATLILLCVITASAVAQVVVVDPVYRYPARIRWSFYDPYFAVTARIYAQADMIRAQGDAAVDYAYARNLHANAYSKELDNWKKELRVYWDRKILAEQKKLELHHVRHIAKMKYLNDRKWQNSRVWDRLKNHQELSGAKIRNGSAHNFLLARLSASALPYEFDPETSRFGFQALEQLKLSDDLLQHITLQQGPIRFAANRSMEKKIQLWPYILRWDDFKQSRSGFEAARAAVVKESFEVGQASVSKIEAMHTALMRLTQEFHRSAKVAAWVEQKHRFTHFFAGDRFLRELDREIVQLEKTGNLQPLGQGQRFDPLTDGNHVISLLCFMNRNGVEFAPAQPGSEFAYHQLFTMMRAVYLTVAEEDESIRPENLGEKAR